MRQSTALPPLKATPMRSIAGLFLGTRLLLVIATYISFILFSLPPHVYSAPPPGKMYFLSAWDHWDAAFYAHIAQYGYQNTNGFHDPAFFPLFPLLIKVVALLFGNHAFPLAAMLVSNLALFGSLYMLYQIATDELGEEVGWRTIVYLCLFPTAFFFFAGYNESLFLFFSCSTLFALRHQKWVLAGILGCLAALTRSAGALLVLPYLYELRMARDESQTSLLSQLKGLILKAPPIILIPMGTLLYSLYCWKYFGDPLAFATVQKYWMRAFTLPWVGIFDALVQLFYVQPFGTFTEVHTLIDLSATLGFIVLAFFGWRRLRFSYTLWIGLLLFYMLSSSAVLSPNSDILASNQRFVLEMFPGFITLAALGVKRPYLHQIVIVLFPFLQAILASLFVLNRWIV
jgi:hypothetical protein